MSADNSQSRISYLEIKIQILEQKYKSEIEKFQKKLEETKPDGHNSHLMKLLKESTMTQKLKQNEIIQLREKEQNLQKLINSMKKSSQSSDKSPNMKNKPKLINISGFQLVRTDIYENSRKIPSLNKDNTFYIRKESDIIDMNELNISTEVNENDKFDRLEQENKSLKEVVEDIGKYIESLKAEIEVLDGDNLNLKDKLEFFQNIEIETTQYQELFNHLEEESNIKEQRNKELMQQVEELSMLLETQRHEYEDLESSNHANILNFNEKEHRFQKKEEELLEKLQNLDEKLRSQERYSQEIQSENQSFHKQSVKERLSHKKKDDELTANSRELQKSQIENEELREKLQAKQEEFNKIIQEKDNNIIDLKGINSDLTKKSVILNEYIVAITSEKETIDKNNENYKKVNIHLKEKLKVFEESFKEYKKKAKGKKMKERGKVVDLLKEVERLKELLEVKANNVEYVEVKSHNNLEEVKVNNDINKEFKEEFKEENKEFDNIFENNNKQLRNLKSLLNDKDDKIWDFRLNTDDSMIHENDEYGHNKKGENIRKDSRFKGNALDEINRLEAKTKGYCEDTYQQVLGENEGLKREIERINKINEEYLEKIKVLEIELMRRKADDEKKMGTKRPKKCCIVKNECIIF